ncbi:glycosyltransferase family 2 protein [Faecalicatena sp. Marseille-Q4148]|nr:glycosyltransferase family 2 protein [Faecalicatena sp. Marseille-Q4148]
MGVEAVVDQIRISVAVVTYNGVRYLEQQLVSILNQLGEEDEVVISDDGSNDGTIDLIRSFQKTDSRIRLISGPGKGVKKNVEHALLHTRGKYIFLADQDDIWIDTKVETVLNCFREKHCMVVIHDAHVFAGENPEEFMMDSFFDFRNAGAGVVKNIVKNSYIGCCMAFRRELLETVIPIPSRIEMHDQWIGVLGDALFGESCFYRKPLLLYRRHGENQSDMKHYGIFKMIRNRIVFVSCFVTRMIREKVCGRQRGKHKGV